MANKRLWESVEGSPYPLGATYIQEEDAFNFAIYSRHATSVALLVYSDKNYSVPIFTYDFDYLIYCIYLILSQNSIIVKVRIQKI